jgi:hypothetical protein
MEPTEILNAIKALTDRIENFEKNSITAQTLDTKLNSLLTEVDKKNSGLASAMEKEYKRVTTTTPTTLPLTTPEEDKQPKLNLKTLETKIETLEKQLVDRDLKLELSKRNALIREKLNNQVNNVKAAELLFNSNFTFKYSPENDEFYTEQGDKVYTIDDAIDQFLESDLGKVVRPPKNTTKGLGVKSVPIYNTGTPGTPPTLNELLFTPMEES